MSLLTACSDDDIDRVYTVGEADNAIVLRAGVNEGGAGVETRSRDGNHTKHLAFTSGTKVALRIDGTWTGHSPATISQQTIATVGDVATNTNGKHNLLSGYNPVRYWDDYGTAAPDNKDTGRADGLTIYGIGVDGYATAVPSSWTVVDWNVGEPTDGLIDQSDATSYWKEKDLLTSNNIRSGADGTLKFDDYIFDKTAAADAKKSSNILEFTHAMTKITVQLTAGEGFPRTEAENANSAHFVAAPTVTLEGFNYTGSVSVEAKTSTPTDDATANIKMHLDGAGNVHTATFDALVFPGNVFADDKQILTFTADGNTLHVNATELNKAIKKAIDETTSTGYPIGTTSGDPKAYDLHLLQAWNYLLKITVKKTDLDITATILDWNTVVAEEDTPKINVDKVYGHPAQDGHEAFTESFDLYRSTSITGSYLGTGDHAVVSCADSKYTMSPQLYWPNHSTHYFFRGVWPLVGSKDANDSQLGPLSSQVKANTIDIANVAYKKGYYPSDLMIGRPLLDDDKTPDETCKVHTSPETQGICATEGKVHINFHYVMSQVEVHLSTTDSSDPDYVNLSNAKVEVVNGYTKGEVALSTVSITNLTDNSDFTLEHIATEGDNYRHSAIVPQDLTYTTPGATTNVRFKITIYNSGDPAQGIDDIYYADINPILKKNSTTEKVAPNGKWESGVHYVYNLTLKKTAINVTATLTDWVEVTAKDEVWF